MRYDSGHITELAGYRLTDRIGSGGMGDVYKAFNGLVSHSFSISIILSVTALIVAFEKPTQ